MVLLRTCTVALLGNPNTGKTTLFNALAGMNQRVGNYPGVTVETKKGRMTWQDRPFDLVDLPGTYSLAARSPDEMVAVDLILGHQDGEARPEVVLSIVDASNLERNLYLTSQILEMGVPVVIALNMIDIAQLHGMRIDAAKLGAQLGVPVVPIQANKGRGLDELRRAIADAGRGGSGKRAKSDQPTAVLALRSPLPAPRIFPTLSNARSRRCGRCSAATSSRSSSAGCSLTSAVTSNHDWKTCTPTCLHWCKRPGNGSRRRGARCRPSRRARAMAGFAK